MKKHWKYLSYVLRHKWFVLVAGIHLGAPLWRLLIHDWTKFLPCEWFAYVNFFYGNYPEWRSISSGLKFAGYPFELTSDYWKSRFETAWKHHQKSNKHHWQYWLRVDQTTGNLHAHKRCGNNVPNVGNPYQLKSSDMVGCSGGHARSITPLTKKGGCENIELESINGIANTTPRIPKNTETTRKGAWKNIASWSLSITVVLRQNARAVGKWSKSFWPWTIRTVVERGTEKNTHAGLVGCTHIGGQLKTSSLKSSESSATTAIPPLAFMGSVPTKKTRILVNDNDGAICLDCRKQFDPSVFEPLMIPDPYIREMVADWMGAGRAITGTWECPAWYGKNKGKIILDPGTRQFVEFLLVHYGTMQ